MHNQKSNLSDHIILQVPFTIKRVQYLSVTFGYELNDLIVLNQLKILVANIDTCLMVIIIQWFPRGPTLVGPIGPP